MSAFGRFRIGANFWSRQAGPHTWSRVADAALATELRQAREIGLDLLRVFAFIPDFVRDDGAIDAARTDKMARFAAEAHALGLQLLPSALVGHMSGENFELPGGGDPLDDTRCETLVTALTAALDGPAIAGWALSNELPLWLGVHEGRRPDEERLLAWIERLIAATRACSRKPVGLGDGQMGHMPNRAIAARVDFVAPHLYGGDADPLRQAVRYDHALALAARFGKPVLFEEYGGSSIQAGDPEHAALWAEGLFAAFSRGAEGALGWCWSDFDVDTLGLEPPYSHHGFELGFGLTRADGSEKPACDVIRAWRALIDGLPAATPIAAPARATLLRSSWLERAYPFSWFDAGLAQRTELTAFALAQQAGLRPAIRDEDAVGDASLVLVPVTQRLLTATWLELEARARAGATVYWSYHGGDHDFHQGSWCPIFERLTGCKHRLRYGCFDPPPELLRLDGALASLPPLPTGVDAAAPQRMPMLAFLPIEPGPHVEVLSRDQDGRPILVEHRLGAGRVIFCAAPIERYAAERADATSRGLVTLYRLLAQRAGLDDPHGLRAIDPSDAERLTVTELSVGEARLVAIMNRSWQRTALPPRLAGRRRWTCAPLGEAGAALGPKQAIVLDAAAA